MRPQSYFRSSGFLQESVIKTDSGLTLDFKSIPAFLRTLLVTDGTVTKSLEAWFWESVKIHPVSNNLEILQAPVSGLEVATGDKVLEREVMLKGADSNDIFACARSTVSLNHLPSEIGIALEKGEIGIGELLREKGVETYRDIFNIDYIKNLPKDDELVSILVSDVLSRSYRIRVNGYPAIIVTEFFPINLYNRE
ncbi:MAG: chorismate-pyruvate lyase [Cocleimonas sp.]|jgi:chorismate-pyruvate lyase